MVKKILIICAVAAFSANAFAGGAVAIANKDATIDKAGVGAAYRGEKSGFKAFSLSGDDATSNAFAEKYTGKSATDLKKIENNNVFSGKALPPKPVDSVANMLKEVSSTPNGIGYVPDGAADASVKVIQ